MELIEYKNVNIGYSKDHNVLENVSFSIKEKSITSFLGANGSGKSTLMMTMNRLIKQNSGDIFIRGRNVEKLSVKELAGEIAFVPQFSESTFNFCVREAILWGRSPYISYLPNKRDYQIVDAVIEKFNIGHLAKKNFNELSGGERQMVLIARAIAQETNIVLMDEPTTYLDLYNQRKILRCIKSINKTDGVTFIVTLHDPNHAFNISDNIMMFKEKRVTVGTNKEMMTEKRLKELYGIECFLKKENEKEYIIVDYD